MEIIINHELKEDEQKKLEEGLRIFETRIGNTPVSKLIESPNLYAKLEYFQFTNSIKIRPAVLIIKEAIFSRKINSNTTIIESTSGNFGIALAHICYALKLKFIPVIDTNTPIEKRNLLNMLSQNVVTIDEEDEYGGYLINRINYVNNYLEKNANCFNPNQYNNEGNPKSYYLGLAEEIIDEFEHLDAVFVSVSSGGTITGLSQRLKEKYPEIKIIAVDVEGSLIFSKEIKKRKLSGIGSSMRSKILDKALIDEVIILDENTIIQGCKLLLKNELIFAGISSGAAYYAAYLHNKKFPNQIGLFICADDAKSYLNIVGNS